MALPEIVERGNPILGRRATTQLLAQKGVQLEALPVAVLHAQQGRVHQAVARLSAQRLSQARDFDGQGQPEALRRAHGGGEEQLPFLFTLCRDGALEQSGNVVHLVPQHIEPEGKRRLIERIVFMLQQVGGHHHGYGQPLDAPGETQQRLAMLRGGGASQVQGEDRLRFGLGKTL
jgi:hypothetical protein